MANEIIIDGNNSEGKFSVVLLDREQSGGAARSDIMSFDAKTGAVTFGKSVTLPSSGGVSGSNTGDVTLTAVGSTPSVNGASLSGQALTLQPADATHPGLVTTGAQSIAGAKTFSSSVNVTTGNGYKVNGTQVVGGQQATIATTVAPAATAAGGSYDQTVAQTAVALVNELKTKFDDLLTKLKTHGLIA